MSGEMEPRPRRSNAELAAVLRTHADTEEALGQYTFAETLREAAEALERTPA